MKIADVNDIESGISSLIKMSDDKKIDRYPGLRPFVKEDSFIFFGRDSEIEILLNAIRVNKAFILYGKSGLGKSSLVHAGLFPKLIAENINPVIIRFYNPEADENNVKDNSREIIIRELLKDYNLDAIDEKVEEIKKKPAVLFEHLPKDQTSLLIFDQFEEFLDYEKKERELAIQFINALLNINLEQKDDTKQPIKLLFLIRSDRLYLMKEVAKTITGILNCTYELTPLNVEKAEEAIELPVQIDLITDKGENLFKIRSYEYSSDALKEILNTLKNESNDIESSQLQIVCQELEEIALNKLNRSNNNENNIINVADFNGADGIKDILNKFYFKQLDKLRTDPDLKFSSKEVRQIRILIEDELVSNNKRIAQSEDRIRDIVAKIRPRVEKIKRRDKIGFIIDKLLSLRLIREEDSHLGKVYEISHDTLLTSIIESKADRIKRAQSNKLIKMILSCAFGVFILFALISSYQIRLKDFQIKTQAARIKEKENAIKQKTDSITGYTNSISKSNISNQKSISRKDELIDSLVDVKEYTINELNNTKKMADYWRDSLNNALKNFGRISKDHQKDSIKLAAVKDSLLSLSSQNNITISSLKMQLIIYSKMDTEIDSLKQVITFLHNRYPHKNSDSLGFLNQPYISDQLFVQQMIQPSFNDLDAKAYSKDSWIKKGYYLQFDNIKVSLEDVSKENRMIKVQICDRTGLTICKSPIAEPIITIDKPFIFSYDNFKYTIKLNKISSLKNDPLSFAAYITFKKSLQ